MKSRITHPALALFLLPAILFLSGCQSMYPKERIPGDLATVTGSSDSIELTSDVTIRVKGRVNTVILYAGKYELVMTSRAGDFYQHPGKAFGLKPPYEAAQNFWGGLYVPRDKAAPCLIWWSIPNSKNLAIQGWMTQAITDAAIKSGEMEFYTWVTRDQAQLPMCR